jgi:hypothetical protein
MLGGRERDRRIQWADDDIVDVSGQRGQRLAIRMYGLDLHVRVQRRPTVYLHDHRSRLYFVLSGGGLMLGIRCMTPALPGGLHRAHARGHEVDGEGVGGAGLRMAREWTDGDRLRGRQWILGEDASLVEQRARATFA